MFLGSEIKVSSVELKIPPFHEMSCYVSSVPRLVFLIPLMPLHLCENCVKQVADIRAFKSTRYNKGC